MKVLQISHSDITGGAARATYRIHHVLRRMDVDSRIWVNQELAGDWSVEGPVTMFEKVLVAIRPHLVNPLLRLLTTENTIIHSPAVLKSAWVKRINESDADLIHLHWVQGEMLSVADISRIQKPIVWTLHDMWAFCGAEHYTEDDRWVEGYRRDNLPSHESGFDLNRWTWGRKRKLWTKPLQLVVPSHWLANCVRESALMREWPVSVILNPIDTDRWQPLEKSLARELLGLPTDATLLLFGAMGGGRDPRKGFDLLQDALRCLRDVPQSKELELVVFGQMAPEQPPDLCFPVHYTGHLHDDLTLRALYSAADVLVIPSRQDNLPNTGVEAQACGTPVVAFDVGGIKDIVEHKRTGYLAKALDAEDLARGIQWVLEDNTRCGQLRMNSRSNAVSRFSSPVVASQYLEVYESVLAAQ